MLTEVVHSVCWEGLESPSEWNLTYLFYLQVEGHIQNNAADI